MCNLLNCFICETKIDEEKILENKVLELSGNVYCSEGCFNIGKEVLITTKDYTVWE